MAYKDLPTPQVARPISLIDPYRHSGAYIRILSSIYHAEAAALQWFMSLRDPRYVEETDLFARASARLATDEQRHLRDIEDMLRLLGAQGPLPPSPAEARFWQSWRSGRLFALPLRANTAAALCLFTEGMGYALIYHLAHATADPALRALLMENLADEQVHLRLSLSILRRALRHERGLLADLAVHLYGFLMAARDPLREQRAIIETFGLDYDVLIGSSLRFLADLFALVIEGSDHDGPLWRGFHAAATLLGERPAAVRLVQLFLFFPEPPLSRKAVYSWGRLNRRRRGPRHPTPAQTQEALFA